MSLKGMERTVPFELFELLRSMIGEGQATKQAEAA